jgi:leader peptidase (prepilin peptidase)/N-methyltransferase
VTSWPIVVTAAALGAVVASYVTTAALRATSEVAPDGARSQCDGCRRQLNWSESLPLVSFALLKGRCRTCAAPISALHPSGEAAGLAAAVAIALVAPDLRAIALGLMASALLAASVIDLRTKILPDLLVATVAVMAAALAAAQGREVLLTGLVASLISLILLGGFSFLYERRRGHVGLGLGDVKLFAALALWLGAATPWMVVFSMGLGLLAAMASPPADRKVIMGPMIAVCGFSIGMLLEVGIWPRL